MINIENNLIDYDFLDNPFDLLFGDQKSHSTDLLTDCDYLDLFNDNEFVEIYEPHEIQKLKEIKRIEVKKCNHKDEIIVIRKGIGYILCELCFKTKKKILKNIKLNAFKMKNVCNHCTRNAEVFELRKNPKSYCYIHLPQEIAKHLYWEPVNGIIKGNIFSYLCINN